MEFINRESELGFLTSLWKENKPQLVVIYGKRRIGKTELSIQFAKDKPHIYFLCEMTAPSIQLKKFTQSIAEYFKDEFLPQKGFGDWETAFKYLVNKKEKMILIIDEFPYLIESDEGIPSFFQKIWDLHLKNSKVYLVVLGSSISMMEKNVLSHKAPLYGRRTGQLQIKPFRFREVKKVFAGRSFEEVLSIYSIAGGIPPYFNKFRGKNCLDVIQEEILQKGKPLYEEVEFLLREEFKEPRNYFAILEALSLGKHKLSEVMNETGFDKGLVSRYISILNSLQITKKEVPITEDIPEKSRKGIYKIDDNFFSFWFRFVFRTRSLLEENRVEEVITKIKETIPVLLAENYEKIAGEILMEDVLGGALPLNFQAYGRWWDNNNEIDLVGVNRRSNEILFGEVKWSNKPVGTNIFDDLKRKSQLVQWGRPGRKEYFALFSKSGFTPDIEKLASREEVFLFEKDKLVISQSTPIT